MAKGLIKTFTGTPFLAALVFGLAFLYLGVGTLFPENTQLWRDKFTIYLVTFAIVGVLGVVASRKTFNELAKAPFLRQVATKFVPSFVLSFAILFVFWSITKQAGIVNPLEALTYVSISVLIFQAFVVAQIEEIMFRGVLFEVVYQEGKNKWAAYLITSIVFALFHYYSSGGSFIVMATYVPLGLAWTYLKFNGYPYLNRKFPQWFGSTRYTNQSNAGSHFAWNIFILGFIRPSVL